MEQIIRDRIGGAKKKKEVSDKQQAARDRFAAAARASRGMPADKRKKFMFNRLKKRRGGGGEGSPISGARSPRPLPEVNELEAYGKFHPRYAGYAESDFQHLPRYAGTSWGPMAQTNYVNETETVSFEPKVKKTKKVKGGVAKPTLKKSRARVRAASPSLSISSSICSNSESPLQGGFASQLESKKKKTAGMDDSYLMGGHDSEYEMDFEKPVSRKSRKAGACGQALSGGRKKRRSRRSASGSRSRSSSRSSRYGGDGDEPLTAGGLQRRSKSYSRSGSRFRSGGLAAAQLFSDKEAPVTGGRRKRRSKRRM